MAHALSPGSRRPNGTAIDGWCGWCCFVAFADVTVAADDGYVVDMVCAASTVRDDVIHLSRCRCEADFVVEFDLAVRTVS